MDPVHDRRSNDGPGYLFLNSFSSRVSDDWKYVCPRRHHYIIARDQKVIYMAHHFNYCLK